MKPRRGDRLNVRIDRLSTGGRGVARHEGLVIFVADTCPDEEVEIELTLVKKNFAVARLLNVVRAGASRVVPPCPVAGICGGCSWQHVSYAEQLNQKQALVGESLRKFAGVATSVAPVIASPDQFRYRNRVQLHHSPARAVFGKPGTDKSARASLGFFKRGSHEIVAIEDCLITETVLCNEFPNLRESLRDQPPGRLEIFVNQEGVAERTRTAELLVDEEDAPAGTAFSQVNTKQNEQMVAFVIDIARKTLADVAKPDLVELYAGGGNFTFPLIDAIPNASLRAAELNPTSVARAQARIAKDYAGRPLKFEAADVERWLAKAIGNDAPDFLLLDPPRTGCGPHVVDHLVNLKARHMVYVSCHPVTLARDLQTLVQGGYEVLNVQPFDMFPQTDHLESVVTLRLKAGI